MAAQILKLHQGNRRVTDYAIDFRTLAAERGWNSSALVGACCERLSDRIEDQLTIMEIPCSLDELVVLSLHVNRRLLERTQEQGRGVPSFWRFFEGSPSSKLTYPGHTPSRSQLFPEERQRCITQRLYLQWHGRAFHCILSIKRPG